MRSQTSGQMRNGRLTILKHFQVHDDDDDDMFHSYLLAGVRFDGSHHKLLCTETIFQ